MASRKTIKVSELVDMVNGICKDSAPEFVDVRQGALNVLEAVLHNSGNYHGYRFLRYDETIGKPGVQTVNGFPHPDFNKRFENTDNTRVMYF